jgi:hypothetical protein
VNVVLTRSDRLPRPGGPNWQQWLTVHNAATGEAIALLHEVMCPDGSVTHRDPATGEHLPGTLDAIIGAAIRTR